MDLHKISLRMFKLVDRDGNQFVDLAEFKKLLPILVPDPKKRGPNPSKTFLKMGASERPDGKLGMDQQVFIEWCSDLLSAKSEEKRNQLVARMIATQDRSTDYSTKCGVLAGTRRVEADKLFRIHDIDCGGALSLDEFMSFIVVYDPSCKEEGVRETFARVAYDDQMDLFEFYEWVQMTFGALDDAEFNKGIGELISAAEAIASGDFSKISEASQLRLLQLRNKTTTSALSQAHTELDELRGSAAKMEHELQNHRQLAAHYQDLEQHNQELQREKAALVKERELVLELVRGGELCTAAPFLELDDETWQPLMQLITRYPELESKNRELSEEVVGFKAAAREQMLQGQSTQVQELQEQVAALQKLMNDMRGIAG